MTAPNEPSNESSNRSSDVAQLKQALTVAAQAYKDSVDQYGKVHVVVRDRLVDYANLLRKANLKDHADRAQGLIQWLNGQLEGEAQGGAAAAPVPSPVDKLAPGQTVPLGELFVKAGVLSEAELKERLTRGEVTRMPLGKMLVEAGDLTNYQLLAVVQAQSLMHDSKLGLTQAVDAIAFIVKENADLDEALKRAGYNPNEGKPTAKLGELLVEANLMSQGDLFRAMAKSFETCLPLGKTLTSMGMVPAETVDATLALQKKLRAETMTRDEVVAELVSFTDTVKAFRAQVEAEHAVAEAAEAAAKAAEAAAKAAAKAAAVAAAEAASKAQLAATELAARAAELARAEEAAATTLADAIQALDPSAAGIKMPPLPPPHPGMQAPPSFPSIQPPFNSNVVTVSDLKAMDHPLRLSGAGLKPVEGQPDEVNRLNQYRYLAQQAYQRGSYPEAEKHYAAALQEAERFGEKDKRFLQALVEMAGFYIMRHEYQIGQSLFFRATTIAAKVLRTDDPLLIALRKKNDALKIYKETGFMSFEISWLE